MNIKLLTTMSMIAYLAACGGGSGGGTGTGGGDTGASFDDVGGVSGSGSSVVVEGVSLSAPISGNGGATHIYQSTDIGGTSVTPTGVIAGSSEIVFAFDPFGDNNEMLLGIDSSQEHTASLSEVALVFNGHYSEALSGSGSNISTGSAIMNVNTSTGTMGLDCGDCYANGAEMIWGMVNLDGTEVEGFSQTIDDDDDAGYIGAVVFGGTEVVGAYGGTDGAVGISGTFGGVAGN